MTVVALTYQIKKKLNVFKIVSVTLITVLFPNNIKVKYESTRHQAIKSEVKQTHILLNFTLNRAFSQNSKFSRLKI